MVFTKAVHLGRGMAIPRQPLPLSPVGWQAALGAVPRHRELDFISHSQYPLQVL